MAVTLDEGPFRRFEGEWRLTPLGPSGCKIGFVFRYEFDTAVVRTLAGPVFDHIATTLVDAFVTRAESLSEARHESIGAPRTPLSPGT